MEKPYIDQTNVGGNNYSLRDTDTRNMISKEYSIEKAYKVNDVVVYEGKLYMCIEENQGIWNETQWQEITLDEYFAGINERIQESVKELGQMLGYINTINSNISTINLNINTIENTAVFKNDIINDLLSTSTNAPLAAAQGKVLNEKIGTVNSKIPTKYAGSVSAGGSANSAVKLDSSAGSATQPVYFSGGKPVVCTYTLGKSVPFNAVFTDTLPGYSKIEGVRNATNTSEGWITAYKYGRVVCVRSWMKLSSSVSQNYTNYTVASGLPGCQDDYFFIGMCSIEDYTGENVYAGMRSNGDLYIDTRFGTEKIPTKSIIIAGAYISAT